MKALMVLTSHDRLGETGHKTGFWLEEFAAPYYVLLDAGVEISLASPKGGAPPMDPRSNEPDAQTAATKRFFSDSDAQFHLSHTLPLRHISAEDYDALFYPGGHGPLWDLAVDPISIELIETFVAASKPVSAVCHGPAVLLKARTPDGTPLVEGRQVTSFTNTEEAAIGLSEVVPFSIEDEVGKLGGQFERTEDWASLAVRDGLLVTGQNPASSEAVAHELVKLLKV